jgi:DNA (cytosine-5)-methyltransferase 1
VEKRIRGLAWVAVRWAKDVSPRVIILENVAEFADWGPLLDDGTPCPMRKGLTFRRFVGNLRGLGYDVDWRELKACDFGAPTTRKRLFLIARNDGVPIEWPAPTHGPGLAPYRTAAECIDWSIPVPSIFSRKRDLAENTQRRIAEGVRRFVLNGKPFIAPLRGTSPGHASVHAIDSPLSTISAQGTHHALGVATLIETANGEREGQAPRCFDIEKPFRTVRATGSQGALVAAFLAKHNGVGEKMVVGQGLDECMHTITSRDQKAPVTVTLMPAEQLGEHAEGAQRVYAFLMKFYGSGSQWSTLHDPMHTIPTKDRMALITVVTVSIGDAQYVIVDIGMRMLGPRELFRAQGFPEDYDIDLDGLLTKDAKVRMCGNSVSPPQAAALVRSQLVDREQLRRVA